MSKIPKAGNTSSAVIFTVPLVPPSVNHYAKHTRSGRHYTTGESDAFKDAVILSANGRYVVGKDFHVSMDIVLGKGQSGDVDNFPKLVLDGLAAGGMFQHPRGHMLSDAHVSSIKVFVDRKGRPLEGYTSILVEALQ